MDSQFACPNCGELIPAWGDQDVGRCENCGGEYPLAGHLCPNCHTYNVAGAAVCLQCGETTTRLCSNCNAVNWSGREGCRQCGTSLDILEYMPQHTAEGRQQRLRNQMQSAGYFKEIEEAGSQKRMIEFMAMEEERQVELSRRLAQQKQRERKMLIIFAIVAALVLLLFVALIILKWLLTYAT